MTLIPTTNKPPANGSRRSVEASLGTTAETLRGNLDAAECKHVRLGLIRLKSISNAVEEKHAALLKKHHADGEECDGYVSEDALRVFPEVRGSYLQGRRKTGPLESLTRTP